MQVTIALLPVSLSLVHIPRSRLDSLSHSILRQLLQPNPAFFNITCNEIELSLFAEYSNLEDFEQIARKDSQRVRSGSNSSRKSSPHHEPVEISYDRWSVLQVDSHSDQIGDNSGTRVHDLSAPLAAAGISILYQSSYTSDFIFVKEARLREVMDLFSASGFDLYTAESQSPISPSYSSVTEDRVSVDLTPGPCNKTAAVFTRNSTDRDVCNRSSSVSSEKSQPSRTNSLSPTSGGVRMLSPDLACVGLSDDLGIDHWGLKIIKLVAFPELIPTTQSHSNPKSTGREISLADLLVRRNISSYSDSSSTSSDEDGYFSHSPQNESTSSLSTTSTSRSCDDIAGSFSGHKSASKHLMSHLSLLSGSTSAAHSALSPLSFTTGPTRPTSSAADKVPFFSFTRTPESSSLTADVKVLATLFPPKERHMVICSGELDAADLRLQREIDGDYFLSYDEEDDTHLFSSNMESNSNYSDHSRSQSCSRERSDASRSYKCLQIDLRGFGLDKHGLVNRFSRVLEENGINHMYSSTFKTANLLVDKKDAIRAQSLLRSC